MKNRIKFYLKNNHNAGEFDPKFILQFILLMPTTAFGVKGWKSLGHGEVKLAAKDWTQGMWIKRIAQRYADHTGRTPNLCAPYTQWGKPA